MSQANNAYFDFQMMMIVGVVLCGISCAAASVYIFPPSNKKKST